MVKLSKDSGVYALINSERYNVKEEKITEKVESKKVKNKTGCISKSIYFATIAVTLLIGFVLGTRGNEIIGAIGPIVGIEIETGTLDLSSVQKVYQELRSNFDGEIDEDALIDGAKHGLVEAAGDNYTIYMNSEESQAFEKDLSGEIGGGIGAEIGIRDNSPTILRVLDNNPAKKAGLMAGDLILSINDEVSVDWTADKVVSKIRGEIGTTVKLMVGRDKGTHEYKITREEISNPSVSSKIENNIGILTLSRFDNETVLLAREAAQRFIQKDVKGVILDLRGNGGGYITAAQDISGLWLSNKSVVSERRGDEIVEELKSGDNALLEKMPTVVLVNGASASASEIVAGALNDYNVATLVGEKTFGKGSVQKLVDLSEGGTLKVTIAKWYTPKGVNIMKDGITPDKKVDLTADDVNKGKDPQMEAALRELIQ